MRLLYHTHPIENKLPTSVNSYIARMNIKYKIKAIDIQNPFNQNFIYKNQSIKELFGYGVGY